MDLSSEKIAVVGLGYVGLPLAMAFARHGPVVGFDTSVRRVEALCRGEDVTREAAPEDLASLDRLTITADPELLKGCGVFIVTVPTPIDLARRPDLTPLIAASETVGRSLRPGGVVIFESTVYPGCTEEVCAPIVARYSGLVLNEGFYLGYSPERINPGDARHRLEQIVKVTSGSTVEAAQAVDALYGSIIAAGTHPASSIKVAEAAKVIENTQRDLNIALMNELAIIFHRIGIDTGEVLAAAGTKWNFLPFVPGLVGGHCIGVDPYYLTHKAQELGYHPEVILAGRRINDGMGSYVAECVSKLMMKRRMPVVDSRILVMGATFKENCPDLRNSQVRSVVQDLRGLNAVVDIWDPYAAEADCEREFGLVPLTATPRDGTYDAIVLAVPHREFVDLGVAQIRAMGKAGSVLYDVKGVLPKQEVDGRL